MQLTKAFEHGTHSTQAWWSCPGLLYFLAVGSPAAAIKIGMLALTKGQSAPTGMRRRLASIQSSNHELVYILGVIHFQEGKHPTKDAEDLERSLHLKFRHLARFKAYTRGSEWFTASPELQAEIGRISQPPGAYEMQQSLGQFLVLPLSEA